MIVDDGDYVTDDYSFKIKGLVMSKWLIYDFIIHLKILSLDKIPYLF